MYCLKFLLKGKHAFFKYPNFNIINFTYSHIHKPALLGLLGAIVGYNGYRSISEDDVYPEYYKKLKNLKISIVPKSERFIKTYYTFNNTSGTACNTKRIENLVTTFQILENINEYFYVFSLPKELDNDLLYKTSQYILTNKKANIISNVDYFKVSGEDILYFF